MTRRAETGLKKARPLTVKALCAVIALLMAAALVMLPTGTAAQAAGQVEISFWSIFPIGDPKLSNMERLIADFEAKNPNIKVKHIGTNFWDYFSKLNTAQAGGVAPDVSLNDIFSVRLRAKSGVIQSLTPYAEGLNTDDFNPRDIETFTYEDGLYALPFSSDYRLLYYNKEQFRAAGLDPDKPPETVEQLVEYAEKLDIYEGNKLVRVGFHPELGNNEFYTDVWNVGGSFFDEEGYPDFTDEKVIKGMQQYVDLAGRYTKRQYNGFYNQSGAGTIDSFISQNASMEVNGDWLAWEMREYIRQDLEENPDKEKSDYDFEWGVAPYPYEEGCRTSYGGGFSLELSAGSAGAKAEAGYKFIEYLTSYEVQLNWIELMRFTPTNMRALETLKGRPDISENELAIFEEAPYKRSPDLCEAIPEWWSYVTPQLDLAMNGSLTVEEAMAKADLNLSNVIKTYRGVKISTRPDTFMIVFLCLLAAGTAAICIFVKKGD